MMWRVTAPQAGLQNSAQLFSVSISGGIGSGKTSDKTFCKGRPAAFTVNAHLLFSPGAATYLTRTRQGVALSMHLNPALCNCAPNSLPQVRLSWDWSHDNADGSHCTVIKLYEQTIRLDCFLFNGESLLSLHGINQWILRGL